MFTFEFDNKFKMEYILINNYRYILTCIHYFKILYKILQKLLCFVLLLKFIYNYLILHFYLPIKNISKKRKIIYKYIVIHNNILKGTFHFIILYIFLIFSKVIFKNENLFYKSAKYIIIFHAQRLILAREI